MKEEMTLPPACHFLIDEILLSPFPLPSLLSVWASYSDLMGEFDTWGASHFISPFLRRTKALSNDGEMEQTQ